MLALAACARDVEYYDHARVVCSRTIDDKLAPVAWDKIDRAMSTAALTGGVIAYHAHIPGITVSREAVARVLDLAAAHDLPTVTFRELARRRLPRAGLALSFDDNTPAAWEALAPLFAERGAHVTFFVTELDAMTDAERSSLHRLAGAGHDIEPHGKMHAHAIGYAREHGVSAYIDDEVMPSLDSLRADGFAPATAFAFPYGEHDAALDAKVLEHVRLIRVGVSCAR